MMALSTGSFGEFILALSEKDCRVICLGQVHLAKILEEYGRTKVWGDQTKAELPARARGSLDDTLRHDVELKYLVQAILMRLRALLNQGKLYRRKHNPFLGSDHDSISSVSADLDSDSNDDGEHRHYRMPKIRLLVQQTLEQIRSLYDMSALLRRPKIADKYIRSVNSRSHIPTLGKPDHLPLSVGFSRSDETHVVEKVLQWRGLTKSARGIEFKFEGVAPIGQGLTKYSVEDILWFCQRLAAANTRRREQFQYWTDHPYDSRQDNINTARLTTPNLAQFGVKEIEEKQEQQNRAPTFQPSIPDVSRGEPRSAVSKQSFSTAAVSDIYDTKTNVRPRAVYAPTAIGQGRSNCVPDPPKIEIGTTSPCPYCGTTLESSEMQNRQSWTRHVFRDLRPYVCTFEDCQNGGKLYVSRHDWMHHELQIHRRNYVCKVCEKMCSSRKEMSAHLREHYDESISPSQLEVILDFCNRQVDILEYEKHSCLVCGEELLLPALQGHLAAHMEDIALFVLPNTNEEDDVGDSKASVNVAKLKSKGNISGTESEPSSLGYSAAGDYRQTPTDFSKLLTSEEAGYTSKFLSWRTTDDGLESAPVKQMMEMNKTKLGEDHPDTLSSMANLASTYTNQGRWEEAEQLQVQVMETNKTKLGEDHPYTLSSMANLASTYTNQGRWEEAEQLQVQVMETSKRILGEDHPNTLSSMANLAFTWKSSAHDAKAINLLRDCLNKQKQRLGLNHPSTSSLSETLLKWETNVTIR
ncbi:hypothetical protein N7472_009404 [Penicillium cf. griseofulvum]|uniref:C2H2-type domain-containing protein n=1 Tax=Penicillium cf. griseofulvum TaxID=2972120 RepID=A0A9W9IV35_9EURO|nr:hypothetical protein N7472_009404 [Penicillium cf. griseofulvum]